MTTIKLIDQFIISNDDSITAQELFEVSGLEYLYGTILQEPPKLYSTRYLFILRHYSKKENRWRVFENTSYQRKGWAQRKFQKNKEHILKYRGTPP